MTDILTGWKEICKYLKVSEKTARNYKKLKGLPITKDPAGHPVIKKQVVDSWKMQERTT